LIQREDIGDALALLTGNASDKTPRPSEVTIRAWMKYFANYPKWTGDDLVAAANEYCKQVRERMVQPADLGQIILIWYREMAEKMNPEDRTSAWEDIGGGPPSGDGTRPPLDIHGFVDKSQLDAPPDPLEWDSDQRLSAYWERLRNGEHRPGRVRDEQPGPEAGFGNAPNEHEPGEECADRSCDKPSTFGDYCARHYATSFKFGQELPA
jgi:hypothetical protein